MSLRSIKQELFSPKLDSKVSERSGSNWNLEVLVFCGGRKTREARENPRSTYGASTPGIEPAENVLTSGVTDKT